MNQIFIANIGVRDVQIELDGRFYRLDRQEHNSQLSRGNQQLAEALQVDTSQIGVRPLCEWLLTHMDEYGEQLRLPILEPVCRTLVNRRFDRVLLSATNQPESTPARFRVNDTLFAARLVERLVKTHSCFERAEFRFIEFQHNPHGYDTTYQFLGERLRELVGPQDTVLAVISGGIPAINAGIRDHVLGLCGKRVALLQVEEPSVPTEPAQCKFISPWPFRRDQILRQVRELLTKSYDYAGTLDLLEDEGVLSNEPQLRSVLTHADRRSQFDWETAVEVLKDEQDQQLRKWCATARHKSTLERLPDVVDCAELALRRRHWRDFVVLVETFVENVWRVLAEDVLPLQFQQKALYLDRIQDQGLREHLQRARPGSNQFVVDKWLCQTAIQYRSDRELGQLQQQLAAQLGASQEQGHAPLGEILDQLDRSVGYLRNAVAHRMANLSLASLEREIQQFVPGNQPLQDTIARMRACLANLGGRTDGTFLYDEINHFGLRQLEKKER